MRQSNFVRPAVDTIGATAPRPNTAPIAAPPPPTPPPPPPPQPPPLLPPLPPPLLQSTSAGLQVTTRCRAAALGGSIVCRVPAHVERPRAQACPAAVSPRPPLFSRRCNAARAASCFWCRLVSVNCAAQASAQQTLAAQRFHVHCDGVNRTQRIMNGRARDVDARALMPSSKADVCSCTTSN